MELTPEHSQRIDSLLAQARKGVVGADLSASVLAAFSDSDAAVFGQILGILRESRFGRSDPVMSLAPGAILKLRAMGPESARALWVAFNALGIAHFRAHQYLSAHHWYEQAFEIATSCDLRSEAKTSMVNTGLAYRGLGDAEKAVAELYRVAADQGSLLANRGPAHLFLSHVYADQGDLDRELAHLWRAIESDGPIEVLEARSMLARALTRRGSVAEARRVLDDTDLQHLGDETPFHWCYYLVAHGDTLAAEGRVEEALICFAAARTRLTGSDSDIPVVMADLSMARGYLTANQTDRAHQILKTMDRESMSIADARDYLSMLILACSRLGHVGSALRAAADRVRLVDNRLASAEALRAVRQKVEREIDLRWEPEAGDQNAGEDRPEEWSKESTLAALLRHPLDSVRSLAAADGVSLTIIDRAQDVTLAVDAEVLDRPLCVLLDNAVRFNRRAGSVEIQLLHCGQTARVRILSTGIGWAPHDRPRVLDNGVLAFTEVPSLASDHNEVSMNRMMLDAPSWVGTGSTASCNLGRSILAARSVGGSIRGSSPGRGSGAVFTLEIPVAAP